MGKTYMAEMEIRFSQYGACTYDIRPNSARPEDLKILYLVNSNEVDGDVTSRHVETQKTPASLSCFPLFAPDRKRSQELHEVWVSGYRHWRTTNVKQRAAEVPLPCGQTEKFITTVIE